MSKITETKGALDKAYDLRDELTKRLVKLERAGEDTTELRKELHIVIDRIAKLRNRWRSQWRYALEKEAGDFTLEQWEKLKETSGGICSYCGERSDDLTADHVIPVTRGGSHTLDNIVVACRKCNSEKGMRTPEEAGMQIVRR